MNVTTSFKTRTRTVTDEVRVHTVTLSDEELALVFAAVGAVAPSDRTDILRRYKVGAFDHIGVETDLYQALKGKVLDLGIGTDPLRSK